MWLFEQFNKNWTVEFIVETKAVQYQKKVVSFSVFFNHIVNRSVFLRHIAWTKTPCEKWSLNQNCKNKKRVDRNYNNYPIASTNGQT